MAKNRIKELRKAHNITLKGLVELLKDRKIKVNASQISSYEKGTSPRNHELWGAMSEIFDVSVPYIKGDSDYIINEEATKAFLKGKLKPQEDVYGVIRLFVEDKIVDKYGEKTLEKIKSNISDKVSEDEIHSKQFTEFTNSINTLSHIDEDYFEVLVLLASLEEKKRKNIISFIKNMID